MTKTVAIGIDGGGTATRVLLIDEEGNDLLRNAGLIAQGIATEVILLQPKRGPWLEGFLAMNLVHEVTYPTIRHNAGDFEDMDNKTAWQALWITHAGISLSPVFRATATTDRPRGRSARFRTPASNLRTRSRTALRGPGRGRTSDSAPRPLRLRRRTHATMGKRTEFQ